MKTKIALVGLFLLSIVGFGQISTTRMNELKIGMRPSEVLKLLGKKPAAIVDEGETNFTLKGIDYTIEIRSGYLSKTENDTYLSSISTTSKNIKTLSGIGIGSTLEDLWKAYSSKYNVLLDKSNNNYREFRIDDRENGVILTFSLKNEIVTIIGLSSYNPEECTL